MKLNKMSTVGVLLGSIVASGFVYAGPTEDTKITTEVKALLAKERNLPATNVHVETQNNIVRLNGLVETQQQANRAIELASSANDVVDVDDNNLKVKSSDSYLSDALITAKTKGKVLQLSNNKKISKKDKVHIETTNGVVHLRGKVRSRKDIDVLKAELSKIKGVKEVRTVF